MTDFTIFNLSIGAIFGWMAAASAEILFLVYGILALVPSGPFKTRNTALGVVLLVLAVTQVAALATFLFVFGVMSLIGLTGRRLVAPGCERCGCCV